MPFDGEHLAQSVLHLKPSESALFSHLNLLKLSGSVYCVLIIDVCQIFELVRQLLGVQCRCFCCGCFIVDVLLWMPHYECFSFWIPLCGCSPWMHLCGYHVVGGKGKLGVSLFGRILSRLSKRESLFLAENELERMKFIKTPCRMQR